MVAQFPLEVDAGRLDLVVRKWRIEALAGKRLRVVVGEARRARVRGRGDARHRRVVAHQVVDVVGLALAVQHLQGQVVGEAAGVAQDVALGADGRRDVGHALVMAALGDNAVMGKGGVVEIGVGLVRGRLVADRGPLEAVVVADVPVDLAKVAGGDVLAVQPADRAGVARVGVLVHAVGLLLDALGRQEHEQLVLDDRAAHVGAGAVGRVAVQVVLREQRAVGVEAVVRVIDVAGLRAQRIRLGAGAGARFPAVGAGLGGDVDHAADRTAELGAVAAGQDLGLGDRAERQFRCAELGKRVGDRETVDVVRILGRAAAAERGAGRIARVGTGGVRGQLDDRADVLLDRQRGQFLGGEGGAIVGVRQVDARAAAAHFHPGDVAEGSVDALADQDVDLAAAGHAAVADEVDLVVAGRQRGGAVVAGRIKAGRTPEAGIGVRQRHGRAGRVGDLAIDDAGGVRLRHRRRHHAEVSAAPPKASRECVD
jgi:hypothetical protein